MNRKQRQVERYLRQAKHFKSPDEQKSLKKKAQARKATRSGSKGRRRHWSEEDDEELPLEKMGAPSGSDAPAAPRAELPEVTVALEGALQGLVLAVFPGRARVLVDGEAHDAVLAGALAAEQRSRVAVGDEAVLERRGDGSLRVAAVLPRRSVLSRPDPSNPNLERVLAANVDRAVVVVAARQPTFKPRLFDRYLIALGRGGVQPVVCVSKVDLLETAGERDEVEEALAPYRALGHPCLTVSSATGEGLEELRRELVRTTAVFVGQSGVGKSSLLNALEPGFELRTNDVRASDGKGRHTTTTSTLLRLSDGSRVIDTPGIRAFGLFDLDRGRLAAFFPEFVAHAPACRFRDCQHLTEPGCAVLEAVERGAIPRVRYDTYGRIHAQLDLLGT